MAQRPRRLLALVGVPLLLLGCVGPRGPAGTGASAPPLPADRLGLLTQGASALSNDEPARAEELLAAYLELEPESAMALFLHGVALLDLGRLEESHEKLAASVELDPDDASGYAVLARVAFELGDLEGAVAALEEAVRCEPESGQHWTSLGLLYYEQDRWSEAYDALLTAVELSPQEEAAHRALGRLYVTVGEFEMAERAFRTALSLSPDDVGIHVALGHVLRDLGDSEEAVRVYNRAAKLDPDNPWIEANIASAFLELHKPYSARPHFEAALALLEGAGLDQAFIYLNYGGMLESMGDLDGALAAYESSVAAAPDMGRAYEALGMLLLHLGERTDALENLAIAFGMGPLAPDALLELALLHEEDEDWTAALQCASRLLEDDSGDPEMDYRRARLRVHSRHPAVHDVDAAVQILEPLVEGALENHAASWELLAEALAQMGALEEAIGAMDGALRAAQPESPVRERFERQRERLVGQLEDG